MNQQSRDFEFDIGEFGGILGLFLRLGPRL
jgi:hypothetical protein